MSGEPEVRARAATRSACLGLVAWMAGAGLDEARLSGTGCPMLPDPMDGPPPGPPGSPEEITRLLRRWGDGDESALDRLIPLVYAELHRVAHRRLGGERTGHTLQTTALVHEAYARLAGSDVRWSDRAHFFALAARAMRRILVDYARRRAASKRGGDADLVTIETSSLGSRRTRAIPWRSSPSMTRSRRWRGRTRARRRSSKRTSSAASRIRRRPRRSESRSRRWTGSCAWRRPGWRASSAEGAAGRSAYRDHPRKGHRGKQKPVPRVDARRRP